MHCRNSACALFGLGLGLCLLGLWENAFPLSEDTAAFCVFGIFLLSTLLLTLLGCRSRRKIGSVNQLALAIEDAHPELLDRFICAVELENRSTPLTGLEQGLLQEMQQKHAVEKDFHTKLFRQYFPWRSILFLSIGAFILLLPASRFAVLRKAQYALSDLRTGQPSGLQIFIPSTEFAVHSDVRIAAVITRWENQAEIEIQEIALSGKPRYRQNMYLQDSGRHTFTLYDLTEKLRFRVITPSLKSSWQELSVFTPPELDSLQIKTIPLPYTRHEVQIFTSFQDFTLTKGESFLLKLEAAPDTNAQLLAEPPPSRLSAMTGTPFCLQAESTTRFQVVLEDSAGHQTLCPPFTVTVEADLPPVLEVQQPTEDSTIKPGDSVLLQILARDDFGLADLFLQFSVSGGERQKLPLYRATNALKAEKEVQYRDLWALESLSLKDGDMLSCMVIATDNRDPKPQMARSDLFFITVRPDANEMESDGESSGQEKKADISDLLAESKRLLRLTWDTLSEQQMAKTKELERRHFELLRDLKELEVEVRRRFNKLQEESQGMIAEPLPSLFQQCSQFLNSAAALLERQLLEESLQPQELALSALVRIENELLKNAIKSKKQGGEGESQESQEESEPQNQTEQKQQDQAKQDLSAMKESLADLENLLKRQQQLNRESESAATLPDELTERQEKLRSDTQKNAEKLRKLPDTGQASSSLNAAADEMSGGRDAFADSDLRRGHLHGQRAHKQLLQARRELAGAIRKAGANQIARLADQAAQLSTAQAATAEQSVLADTSDQAQNRELRQQQEQLKAGTEKLEQEIASVSSLLEEDYPEASQALRNANQQAKQRGLSKKQSRAQNALLYRQYEAAAKEQRDAANLLQALAQELHASAEKLPPMSSEELREMLQQLQQYSEQVEAAGRQSSESRRQQQLQQARENAAQMLQNAADPLQDSRLQQLVDDLRLPDGESSSGEVGKRIQAMFKAAGTVLQEHLARFLLQNKLNFTRESVSPPKKYKRQVEEYFKDLGSE